MKIELADRISNLPPYLFAAIDKAKNAARARGVDIIDLGVGDPDVPTFPNIVAKLKEAAGNPAYHRYPSYEGMLSFRQAVADWYRRRFNVKLDAGSEVVSLIGAKEGIAHIPWAFINPGDVSLVPSPAYPVYNIATKFAGGDSHIMPLLEENGFLPDLDAIPAGVAGKAKLMFLNYPNNPTSAVADEEFFKRVIEYAYKHNVIIIHDAAYSEIYYDDYKPISFLEVDGAMEVGIEVHSLSKTYNMTGWRIAFAAGNAEVIGGLGKIKTNVDSGAFEAIQVAGIEAIEGDQSGLESLRELYDSRRKTLVEGLRAAGFEVEYPKAALYVWMRVPGGYDSAGFATALLDKAGIVATPGNGFGDEGEGYVRMTLCLPAERLQEAVARIKEAGLV